MKIKESKKEVLLQKRIICRRGHRERKTIIDYVLQPLNHT